MATIIRRGARWRAQVRKGGKSLSASFGTKAKALAWAADQERSIDDSDGFAGYGKTFGDLLTQYRDTVSVRKRGARREMLWIGVMLRDPVASVPLESLNAAHIADWRDRRLAAVSPATVNREMAILSHACHIAHREWLWLRSVPTSSVGRPKTGDARTRRPTAQEIEALILASGYSPGEPTRTQTQRTVAAFLLACETGMRSGEILAITRDTIHDRHMHLPKTKNGHARDVPLTDEARRLIDQVLATAPASGPIFDLTEGNRDALFRKLKAMAGITDLHFHDSRREALTRLSKIFGVMELARISGHRDLRILQNVYYAPDVSDLADKLK